MQLAMIGLGRMGANMVRRLLRGRHEVVVYDRTPAAAEAVAREGATAAASLRDLVARLARPGAAWRMVPAGGPTEETIGQLAALMQSGDIIIDGGNSFFQDDVRRARTLRMKGIQYVDVGTSGGIWGLERGYCMMVGGEPPVIAHLDPLLRTLAPGPFPGVTPKTTAEAGYLYCGPAGAGQFVKMIHNGIEYGLMQAYAEGFDILRGANSENLPVGLSYDLNLADIAEVWRRGSVISSWLLDLTAIALASDNKLDAYSGFVEDSGEGRWTIAAALEEGVSAEVLSTALYTRFRSREEHSFAEKILSAMRKGFGGHVERPLAIKMKQGL